ncbi:hypothetical protein SLEP1_g48676 [Rubroshorea leprosula]|uniref:DUF4218 domain-containing protein n=1 Tax=Rubroshorea leprosula TaxID=152421 RepID=A0AAV5LXE2_9ROSI|nr:hypothetical protein SLEP1_g48676 [Rubroshorea leprosula]
MECVRNEVNALYHEMVVDAMGAQSEYNEGPMAEEPNSKAREFYDLLHAAKVHIGVEGQDVTVFSWMTEMLNMKTLYNMSAANWDMAFSLSRKLLSPEDQEKDNTNAILDLQLYCNRFELELIPQDDGTAIKPNATYVLTREQRALIYQWLKELRFSDGYASNIARCVNIQELQLFGMKSHDCHVFMQRLLPIAFRDFLIDEVWGPLTEISNFFRALTAPIIQVSNMKMWEEKIVETICKLEKVFLLAFFDSIEHLAIHLPYEAKVGGPIQFRWINSFERKGWFTACKIRARAIIDTSSLSNGGNVYYQDDDPPMPQLQEQPTITQSPLDDDQYTDDDATMEEDTEEHGCQNRVLNRQIVRFYNFRYGFRVKSMLKSESHEIRRRNQCNLEAELDAEFAMLDAEFAMLDPELDAQLEEELSRAVLKIGRGMDKGDDASANPSQRKVLSLNCRGTFNHERFGRIATVIWKYLYDEPVPFWSSWPEEKKRVAWENFQNDAHQKYVEKHGTNKDSWPEWDPLIWKEVVRPPKKGQMRGMSTLQDPAEHGIPWRRYDMSEASSSTTRILTTQRVTEMEASFERRFQEHMCLLSQQYSMNATQPQTGYPSSTPPQTADPSFGGFRLDHLPPPT